MENNNEEAAKSRQEQLQQAAAVVDERMSARDEVDAENEMWGNENIVFLPEGFWVLDRGAHFRSKTHLQDNYAQRAQTIPPRTDRGQPTTVHIVDRIKDNPHKLEANGLGWLPVPVGEKSPLVEIEGNMYVNTYQQNTVEPVEGDVSKFTELAEFICGEHADEVLDHMAFTVQYPEKKIVWQVFVYDELKRNGKSALFHPLLYVTNSAGTVDPEQLKQWDDGYVGRKTLIFEEVYGWGRSHFNKLKTKFANGDFETLNPKGKPTVKQANRYSMYILSNHEDAFKMDVDEGKLLVVRAPGKFIKGAGADNLPNAESRKWYSEYWDWLRSEEGKGAMLYYLMNRDVSNFNYNQPPVITDALRDAVDSGEMAYKRSIREAFEDRSAPFDKVGVMLPEFAARVSMQYHGVNENSVRQSLKRLGFVSCKGQRKMGGTNHTVRYWAEKRIVENMTPRELYDVANELSLKYVEKPLKIVHEALTEVIETMEKVEETVVEKVDTPKRGFDFMDDPLMEQVKKIVL